MTNVLGLRASVRHGPVADGKRDGPNESHYLAFLVDGRPLTELLAVTGDFITGLNRPWLHTLEQELDHLCGRRPDAELPPDRVALLRCGACGDIGCGALTARLSMDEGHITWSDFAWEDDVDRDRTSEYLPEWDEYRALIFVFDRESYLDTLSRAYATVARLPCGAPSHQARKTRWPWRRGQQFQ